MKVKHNIFFLRIVFILGLVVLPLVFWPSAEIPYEIPRVWFVWRWIELLILVGIVVAPWVLKRREVNGKLLGLVLAFVGVAFLSSVFGEDFQKSVWGNYYRRDGLITLVHLMGLAIFISLYWQKSWRRGTALAIAVGSALTSGWAVIDGVRFYLGEVSVSDWGGAIGVSFGQPNFLAGYLLVTLPFLQYLLRVSKTRMERSFWIGALVMQIGAIGLTRSWAGILGVMIFWLFWLIIQKKRLRLWGSLLVIGLAVGGFAFFKQYRAQGFLPEGRVRIFRKLLLAVAERPLLGWGWANVDQAFEANEWPLRFEHDVYLDKAHSQVLEVLVTTGFVGLVIYFLLIFGLGKKLFNKAYKTSTKDKMWCRTILVVFFLYLFHSQTNVISIAEETLFWMLVGVGIQS